MTENDMIYGFLLNVRLALAYNPLADPDKIVKRVANVAHRDRIYEGSPTQGYVRGCVNHATPYAVIRPGIEEQIRQTG